MCRQFSSSLFHFIPIVSLKPSSYLFTMQEKPECITSTLLWHFSISKTFSWVSPNYLWFNNQYNSIISILNNERLKFGSKFPRSAFLISESANYCTPEIPGVHWCIKKLVASAVNSTMKCLSSGVDRKGPFFPCLSVYCPAPPTLCGPSRDESTTLFIRHSSYKNI